MLRNLGLNILIDDEFDLQLWGRLRGKVSRGMVM